MPLYFKIAGDKIVFFGDTFNHRPAIKELGARFNGADKTWIVNDSDEMRARAAIIAKPLADNQLETSGAKNQPTSALVTSAKGNGTAQIDPEIGMTISQLMSLADRAITQTFPTPIWIIGEIQSRSTRAGGTVYFDLAEGKSGAHQTATVTVKCNIWQNTLQWIQRRHGKERVDSVLLDGNRLRALVHVKLYKDRGQITLTIEDIDPLFTQGALALARAELLKKLRLEGLDQKNKLLPMPAFPLRIALITADGSRAYSDFEHQLTSSNVFCGVLIFIPCTMQGENVPKSVCSAIGKAHSLSADVIVLCRGGGSAADLRWFDGEEIALAIAQSEIPVIAAIGHHDDTCVAEEISHTREKTPTAAADKILGILMDTRVSINEKAHTLAAMLDHEMTKFDRIQSNLKERLNSALEHLFSNYHKNLLIQSMALHRSFELLLNKKDSHFLTVISQINHSVHLLLQKMSETLFERHQNLIKLDPAPWLKAGWTQLTKNGHKIISIEEAEIGTLATARLTDGTLTLRIEEKHFRPKGNVNGKA